MKIAATEIPGAFTLDILPVLDERGFFARTWCRKELAQANLSTELSQFSVSFNHCKGTVRGMHYQRLPHEETKIVRCTQGAIYDVLVDLRPNSASYLRWLAFELSAANRRMLYIPEGIAHGFQTLEDNSEVFYMISDAYHPECSAGLRWDDPALGIEWPLPVSNISEKDRSYPDFPSNCVSVMIS